MSWKVFDIQGRLLINDGNSGICAPVVILDQNLVVRALVPSGGTYEVVFADGVEDGTPLNIPVDSLISNPF